MKLFVPLAIAGIALVIFSFIDRPARPRILVFSKTAGFRHASIAAGKQAIMKLGEENGFSVDTTEDAEWFTDKGLRRYSAIVFLNTTGDILNDVQQTAFEHYIKGGGGFVGIHSATDTEYGWEWYGKLVGAYFLNHPKPQQAKIIVQDNTNIATKHLPKEWVRTDEWYNFKNLSNQVHVLLMIDEKSYEGGKNGDYHPMAWYHDFEGGRAFYTELGHTDESYKEENYLKHILGGIKYAMGRDYKEKKAK